VVRLKEEYYDAAVIGAGIGGMCAAALLTHQGYKVLVVEKLPQLGGRCSTIEYKGFKIPHGAWEQPIYGTTAALFKEVGAEFDVRPQPPIVYRIRGKDYELPQKGQFAAALSICCKDEAEFNRVRTAIRRATTWLEPSSSVSLRDWLLQYTDNETVMDFFQTPCVGLLTSNIDEIPAQAFMVCYKAAMREWSETGMPPGGNIALMESLAKVVRARDGEIWTRSLAKRILTTDGLVQGIVVDKEGTEIEITARAVISNAGPKETMSLVGEENLDKGYVKELEQNLHPTCLIATAIVSDRPLHHYPGGLNIVGGRRVASVSCVTLNCPELAPLGKHLHLASAGPKPQLGPLNLEEEIHLIMEDLRENLPGLNKHGDILNISCHHGDWPAYRSLPHYWVPQKTPVENLYNVGDAVAPVGWLGSGGAGLSARAVVEDVKTRFKPAEV